MFLAGNGNTKGSVVSGRGAFPEFNMLLIVWCMQFWFVGIIPIYMNFAASFSCELLDVFVCADFVLLPDDETLT
jgi:hypothetical protein